MENIKFNIDDFWDRVKNLCKENYATLKDFSVQIGLAPRAIENQRQTKANPKLEQLINMAYYFDVSLDYLITGLQTLPSKSSQEKTKQLTANIKARLDTKNFRLSESESEHRQIKSGSSCPFHGTTDKSTQAGKARTIPEVLYTI